jgi:hypothetical protein
MTCQNLQNKLLNITVLFIWYLLQIVGEFKKNVTRQTWQAPSMQKVYLTDTLPSIQQVCLTDTLPSM